jgi:hypothetical protein
LRSFKSWKPDGNNKNDPAQHKKFEVQDTGLRTVEEEEKEYHLQLQLSNMMIHKHTHEKGMEPESKRIT